MTHAGFLVRMYVHHNNRRGMFYLRCRVTCLVDLGRSSGLRTAVPDSPHDLTRYVRAHIWSLSCSYACFGFCCARLDGAGALATRGIEQDLLGSRHFFVFHPKRTEGTLPDKTPYSRFFDEQAPDTHTVHRRIDHGETSGPCGKPDNYRCHDGSTYSYVLEVFLLSWVGCCFWLQLVNFLCPSFAKLSISHSTQEHK